jgi:hypothetical protein
MNRRDFFAWLGNLGIAVPVLPVLLSRVTRPRITGGPVLSGSTTKVLHGPIVGRHYSHIVLDDGWVEIDIGRTKLNGKEVDKVIAAIFQAMP